MVPDSSTSRAPTPASSWVAICASTPRSTARSTISRRGRAISVSATGICDYFASRSRMALTVDTRTATEYGVVRTFGQGDFQFTTQANNTVNPNVVQRVAAGCRHHRLCSTSRVKAMWPSKWCSSSSLASPSVSRLRPTPRRGMAIRATTPRSCSAVMTPSPA